MTQTITTIVISKLEIRNIYEIDAFLSNSPNNPNKIPRKVIEKGMNSGFVVFGFSNSDQILGIIALHDEFGKVMLVETHGDDRIELSMIKSVAHLRLIKSKPFILSESSVSSNLLKNLDLHKVSRFYMSIDSKKEISSQPLPEGYRFTKWDSSLLAEAIKLMSQVTGGSVDGELFPQFKTLEGCENYIQTILSEQKNVDFCHLLFRNNILIGFSFMEIKENVIELSVMGLDKKFRGKGLGKAILYRSLKYASRYFNIIELQVTATNTQALNLYLKTGFDVISEEVIYYQ